MLNNFHLNREAYYELYDLGRKWATYDGINVAHLRWFVLLLYRPSYNFTYLKLLLAY